MNSGSTQKGRLIEWEHAFIFFLIGCTLLLPYSILESSSVFISFINILPPGSANNAQFVWGLFMVFLGLIRSFVLIFEKLYSSAYTIIVLRISLSIVYMLIFNMLVVAFITAWPQGIWAASVYLILMIFEMMVIWRATLYFKFLVKRNV